MADEEIDQPGDYELSDREVLARIALMDRKLRKFRDADRVQSERYLDANAGTSGSTSHWTDDEDWNDGADRDDTPDDVPIGQPNYLAMGNEIKMAQVMMGMPKLHVKANEDEQHDGVANAGQTVAKMWAKDWDEGNWRREFQAAHQKLGICGLGTIWARWDTEYGPCFSHVPSKRLMIDPHATNLAKLEYGAVKVWMSVRKARKLYDKEGEESVFTVDENWSREGKNLDNQRVGIAIYFDRDSERHAYNDKVLFKDKNLYGRVPLFFIEGTIDPRDKPLPLGDNVFASGLNQQIVDLAQQASNAAKHGGQITIGDSSFFDVPTQQAIKEGKQQQVVFTKKQLNPQALPLHRLAAEQLSDAWTEARREAQAAIDGWQGVTPGARGQSQQNVTATQSVMVENKAGARPTQAQADSEILLTRCANYYVWMYQKFGGPTQSDPGTSMTRHIWQCFKAVLEVSVIEGSASFAPPAANQQASMQFYTTVMNTYQSWLIAHQAGQVDELPSLKAVFKHLVRAFVYQESEQFLIPAPPAPQQPQGPPKELLDFMDTIYKDAPPDVQRAIEQSAGLPPSQMGNAIEGAKAAAETSAENARTAQDQEHDLVKQAQEHEHEAALTEVQQRHEEKMKKLDIWGKIKAIMVKPKPALAAKKPAGKK